MHVHGKYCFVCNMFTGDLKLFCSLRRNFHLVSKLTGDTALLITMKPSVESLQSWRMLTCHPAFFFFFCLRQSTPNPKFHLFSPCLPPPHSCSVVVRRKKTKRRCILGDSGQGMAAVVQRLGLQKL